MATVQIGSWYPGSKGGRCFNVRLDDGALVKIIEAGNGEYAEMQVPPLGYSERELIEIARSRAGNKLRYYNAGSFPQPEALAIPSRQVGVGRKQKSTYLWED